MTGGVRPLSSAALAREGRVRHGFFTRHGGVSGPPYDSLNCGYGSGDDQAAVGENRTRALAAFDLPAQNLNTCYQIHSATAIIAEAPWQPDAAPRADALVTRRPGLALGILTADCAPVLFADTEAGVIGAAHAGWRGALAGITDATIEAMTQAGAVRERIGAAIGPCIGPAIYEVGPEFPAPFMCADNANAGFFRPAERAGHHLFDLPGYVAYRLTRAGVGQVEALDLDTYAEPDRFFSYRRATHRGESDYGRLLSAIMLCD